jgi:hypothetical protein
MPTTRLAKVKPVTDPAVLVAIEAELMLAVYDAERIAELRRLGALPAPPRDPRAPKLLLRIDARLAARDGREPG